MTPTAALRAANKAATRARPGRTPEDSGAATSGPVPPIYRPPSKCTSLGRSRLATLKTHNSCLARSEQGSDAGSSRSASWRICHSAAGFRLKCWDNRRVYSVTVQSGPSTRRAPSGSGCARGEGWDGSRSRAGVLDARRGAVRAKWRAAGRLLRPARSGTELAPTLAVSTPTGTRRVREASRALRAVGGEPVHATVRRNGLQASTGRRGGELRGAARGELCGGAASTHGPVANARSLRHDAHPALHRSD